MNVVERIQEATAPSVSSIQNVSRIEVAHTAHSRACERVDELAVECRSAFEQLLRAQEQLKAAGVETNVKMPFPLSEAYADFRAKQILKK